MSGGRLDQDDEVKSTTLRPDGMHHERTHVDAVTRRGKKARRPSCKTPVQTLLKSRAHVFSYPLPLVHRNSSLRRAWFDQRKGSRGSLINVAGTERGAIYHMGQFPPLHQHFPIARMLTNTRVHHYHKQRPSPLPTALARSPPQIQTADFPI